MRIGNSKYYCKYIEKMIAENPITITIVRVKKTEDGFGGVIEEEIVIEETVTFYNKKSVREVVNEAGKSFAYATVASEKLLAFADADIKEGDSFMHEGREYRISFMKNYKDICKQAELQVIG